MGKHTRAQCRDQITECRQIRLLPQTRRRDLISHPACQRQPGLLYRHHRQQRVINAAGLHTTAGSRISVRKPAEKDNRISPDSADPADGEAHPDTVPGSDY